MQRGSQIDSMDALDLGKLWARKSSPNGSSLIDNLAMQSNTESGDRCVVVSDGAERGGNIGRRESVQGIRRRQWQLEARAVSIRAGKAGGKLAVVARWLEFGFDFEYICALFLN